MRITFDNQVQASYIYFTEIGYCGVDYTIPNYEIRVGLDKDDQIVTIVTTESNRLWFRDKLDHALLHSEVTYDSSSQALRICFVLDPIIERVVLWECNFDIDNGGQILGLEILLYDSPVQPPSDGIEMLRAQGRLNHILKYIK